MSKKVAVLVAVVAMVAGYGFMAFAADAPACPAKAAECTGMKATMTGKVEVKTEKVDGKDTKVPYLALSECKADDGKTCCADMKGKAVKLVGAKAADAEKLAGKQVEVKGTCKGGKEVDVASVAEKK